jgi:L-2-hydroxyglutarate oxidase LhgO
VGVTKTIDAQLGDDQSECHRQHDDECGRAVDDHTLQQVCIDISKALQVNVEFDLSRQLWSFLVKSGSIPDPRAFIHPVPHMSFVWGAENVAFLRKRFAAMTSSHCYRGMEYSEDRKKIADWVPLVMEGRTGSDPLAATRIITGTDVDYGALTRLLVAHLPVGRRAGAAQRRS